MNILNHDEKKKLVCVCGYSGNDFTEIVFVLNDSIITIDTASEGDIRTEKALKMYARPKCGTPKVSGI